MKAASENNARSLAQSARDYARIAEALSYLKRHFREQPSLEEVAGRHGSSQYHFQRLFRRWVGISPKKFLQYLTVDFAKKRLSASRSVLEASYESGLSGPGRLHDLMVSCEAVTPGQHKSSGRDLTVRFGFHSTPFGGCFVAATERGICAMEFLDYAESEEPISRLRDKWPQARIVEQRRYTEGLIERIFAPPKTEEGRRFKLLLKGTNFQIQVWQALLKVPEGMVVSYRDVAEWLGNGKASRAVAAAVAKNPIAYLIPCHRVIRSLGVIGGYRWGSERKQAMLAWEFSRGGLDLA